MKVDQKLTLGERLGRDSPNRAAAGTRSAAQFQESGNLRVCILKVDRKLTLGERPG